MIIKQLKYTEEHKSKYIYNKFASARERNRRREEASLLKYHRRYGDHEFLR